MEYSVKVDAFEGPLDLLLHLINSLEIDIYDIPMAQITEQYLMYVHAMKELKLDVASEYLVMAATLLAIKSKTLLPKHHDDLDEEEFEFEDEMDPRDELVERLIEYKKYKSAADELKQREQERGQIFTKPPSDLSEIAGAASSEKLELNVTIYDMLGAFNKLLRRKKLQKPVTTRISRQELSIEKRMEEVMVELRSFTGRKSFAELFPYEEKDHIVVTFLAILELMKRNELLVEQEGNFDDIFITAKEGAEVIGNR
ncbi:segregation/condensation protein A [Falsibacillus pallidus]|uniref:Segregation and condensation protein A n=1 Tax=Falsibacillus pallidus TaxID=493781 RepID=A0A370GBT6_9BACI|nr:segregation/condensation protein A [Falsibacillus pallidus]RDI41282.1 condensin subunit ScpA [Falsibacillus pallidus]